MNILQVATVDNGGAGWFFKDAIERFTEHECRAIRTHNGHLDYPADVVDPTGAEIAELYAWADVIHIHDQAFPLVSKFAQKPTVVTWHGSRYRENYDTFNQRCKKRGWLITVSTLDLTLFGGEWLPSPRRDMIGFWNPTRAFVACHAPTDRERKGTHLVTEGILAAGADLELITNSSYKKCLQRKARADCLVDSAGPNSPGYGNNAIEAWALGMPVVTTLSAPRYRDLFIEAGGALPFVEVQPTVEGVAWGVARLLESPLFYHHVQEAGRAWFFRFHHAPIVAAQVVELYERARQ